MSRELAPKAPSVRPKRNSLTQRGRLNVQNKDPNYVYRVVNDQPGRVEVLKEMGYEMVQASDVSVGDKRVDLGATVGSAATLSLGGGDRGVVMRIPKEWYDEDQAEKQALVSRSEQTMKEEARANGLNGKLEISRG